MFLSFPKAFAVGVVSLLVTTPLTFAAEPTGTPLLPAKAGAFTYSGPGNAGTVARVVPVSNQEFAEALQIDTASLTDKKGDSEFYARIPDGVKKGDVLWISFAARNLASTRESGEAAFEIRFDRLVNGKFRWPPHLERGVSVGSEWTVTSIPFQMDSDASAADVRVALSFDRYAQRFEIGPVTFLNYGPGKNLAALPRSVVGYGGSEPAAPWRQAAAERIEKFRKGDLTLRLVDRDGAPVPDATVKVRMRRLDFALGTAVSSDRILDETDPNARKYREVLEKNFNQVVFENEMKWLRWARPDHTPEPTLRALDWLDERGITARGHVMVWPSWKKMPPFMSDLKGDPVALRAAVKKHVAAQTSAMKGRFVEWDVTNELFAHHDLVDVLGRDEIVAWYEAADSGAPDVKLFYNDYTMFHPAGPGPEHFYETVKFLKEKGAPLDGIGEQAHIAGSPPPIPLVIERLERFAGLGYPVTITEFDLSTADEDFQARYLGDFMTAIFSSPNVIGFVQWGFWAGQHWFPAAALWNTDWTLRKHGQVFTDMVTKAWRTDADGHTKPDGTYQTRAFYGDYDVTVIRGDREQTVPIKLRPGSGEQTITLR